MSLPMETVVSRSDQIGQKLHNLHSPADNTENLACFLNVAFTKDFPDSVKLMGNWMKFMGEHCRTRGAKNTNLVISLSYESCNHILNNPEFINSFFSHFTGEWKTIDNCYSVAFMYLCVAIFCPKSPSVDELFSTSRPLFVDACTEIGTIFNENIYWIFQAKHGKVLDFNYRDTVEIDLRIRIYHDYLDQFFVKSIYKDHHYFINKYGFAYASKHMKYVVDNLKKKPTYVQMLKDNRYNIDLFSEHFYFQHSLVSHGIILPDFYICNPENILKRCYGNLLDEMQFNFLCNSARELPHDKDFLTKFFHRINFSMRNIGQFFQSYPDNGLTQEENFTLIGRYFTKEQGDFSSILQFGLKSKELFSFIINNKLFSKSQIIKSIQKGKVVFSNIDFSIDELRGIARDLKANYFIVDKFLIILGIYERIGGNLLSIDDLIVISEIIHPNYTRILSEIQNQSHEIKTKINCVILISHFVNCLINKTPLTKPENMFVNEHMTSNFLRVIQSISGRYYEVFSLVHLNKSFQMNCSHLISSSTDLIVNFTGMNNHPSVIFLDIEFKEEWEKVYATFYHKFCIDTCKCDTTEKLDSNLALFKEHYTSNFDCYNMDVFRFSKMYEYILQVFLFNKREYLAQHFIAETKFVDRKFCTILNTSKYITLMSGYKIEEKANIEIDSIVTTLKREREEYERECKSALDDPNITPTLKKICETALSHSKQFVVTRYLANNPGRFSSCIICCGTYKISGFEAYSCGHYCCISCGAQLKNCPKCRAVIESRSKMLEQESMTEFFCEKMN